MCEPRPACRDREETRRPGLTTPDKPVARRPSTVPVQGRSSSGGTNERVNARTWGLASHRSTLLRMLLFVPLASTSRSAPFLLLLSYSLSPCTPAHHRTLTNRRSTKSFPSRCRRGRMTSSSTFRKKKKTDSDARRIFKRGPTTFANRVSTSSQPSWMDLGRDSVGLWGEGRRRSGPFLSLASAVTFTGRKRPSCGAVTRLAILETIGDGGALFAGNFRHKGTGGTSLAN